MMTKVIGINILKKTALNREGEMPVDHVNVSSTGVD